MLMLITLPNMSSVPSTSHRTNILAITHSAPGPILYLPFWLGQPARILVATPPQFTFRSFHSCSMAIGSTICWILSQHWSLQLLSAAILAIYGIVAMFIAFSSLQSSSSSSASLPLAPHLWRSSSWSPSLAPLCCLSHTSFLHALPLVVVVVEEEEEPVMMVNRQCRQWIKGGNIGKIVG